MLRQAADKEALTSVRWRGSHMVPPAIDLLLVRTLERLKSDGWSSKIAQWSTGKRVVNFNVVWHLGVK